MIKIKEAIIVEGRYDCNTLRQIVDTVILDTGGFRIFNDKERLQMLRKIAQVRGLLILTDSDGAGFVIRNYLKGALPSASVKHAYIPDIFGKEKRKRQPGKEGKIGVEGMRPDILEQAIRNAGVTVLEQPLSMDRQSVSLQKADLYELGLSGKPDSAIRRYALLKRLALPTHLSANALLEYINAVSNIVEVREILSALSENQE